MKQQEKFLYISAGKGPAECEWVVRRLLDVISKYLKDVDVRFEIVNTSEGRFEHTYKSVQLYLLGMNIDIVSI